MEFGATAATLSKKLSNGYGVSGRSAYDGVFATPIKLRAPSFSSKFDDYCEIFGGSEASLGSSIPILELPELNDGKKLDDVRLSKLDYSKIFGGFGTLDNAIPFQELLGEPKQKDSLSKEASAWSKAKGGNQSSGEDDNYSKEIPEVSQQTSSFNDAKKINMSYHKVSQGSENGTNGTTHIAQLHAVPAYTCLIEEVNPVKMKRDNKSIPLAQDAYSGSHCNKGIKEDGHRTKLFTGPSTDTAKKQSSNGGVKVQNRSNSIHLFPDACEISNGSDGAHHNKVPPSETVAGNLDDHNGDAMRSMATKCKASKIDTSHGAADADSLSYLDDVVDSNSEAAASLAALRKAIEEAQVRMKAAKESMRRKKEGFPDDVKRKSSIDLKDEGKKEAKLAYKTMKLEEINTWQTLREMDALQQVSSEIGKLTMRREQVRSDLRAKEMFVGKEAVREAQTKLESTQAEHKKEVEQKEAYHKAKVIELREPDNNKNVLYIEKPDRKAFEKPEESDQTAEVMKGDWERENNEEKVCAGNEAGGCEEVLEETKLKCQELVNETELLQEILDNGTTDKTLQVNDDAEELTTGNIKQVACKTEEDGNKVEGSFELEECQRSLRDLQELRVVEMGTAQEQKGIEEKAEVSGELEVCELTEFLEPIDNEPMLSSHSLGLKSMEKEIENLWCIEDGKRRNEAGFLDINREMEHSYLREGTENIFRSTCGQEIQDEIMDHISVEQQIFERITKDGELDRKERDQDAKESENELEGGTHLMEDNEMGTKDSKEPVEVMRVTQTGPNYEEIEVKEAGKATETISNHEPDETEELGKTQVDDTIIENDETLKVTPEVYAHDMLENIMVAGDASFQHQEAYEKPETVQQTNDFWDNHAVETSAFTQGALQQNEAVNQKQNTNETVTFEAAATHIGETDIKVCQNQDQCLEIAENVFKATNLVEEQAPESLEICKDAREAKVALNEEIDEYQSNFSDEGSLSDNEHTVEASQDQGSLSDHEHNVEASQIPSMSEWKSSPFKDEEVKTIHNNLKENHHASLTMEEKEASGTSQKVELGKEQHTKIDEAKERKREREKEKLAVERAIREARERAFAEARERAALERAASEARQKNISDGRERQGKTTVHANEKTRAEKAAMEAKLKAERAAVERATAEARARALERALSEKAAFEARNKSDKSVGEKCFGASRDNGMKQNLHSKSFSYGDLFDGANGDSAQRCKARSERHQRIGERVAKALADKNIRDRLVQKEQEERNRVAEVLDADVKRWSSGKAGNLRALLSTLQYILGPDSGWQPIPLTDIVTATAVKKAYRKATLFVHPDKLQQRGASIQQKYTCEKVFDLLKEAWNKFNMEER